MFSLDEVERGIRKLKNNKSAGRDKIGGEMLKHATESCIKWVWEFFNKCNKVGKVPLDWRIATIVMLYKGKGDKAECKNHRGISLLSVLGKLYGRLVIERIREETDSKVWDTQGGFRPGRGCTDQIFSLQQIVEKYLSRNKRVYCAFVDLEKAYDRPDLGSRP